VASIDRPPAAATGVWRFHSSDAHAANVSRHEMSQFLRDAAADADEVFAAELVVGEILANTVQHAPGLVEMHVDWSGERPVITIRDSGPGLQRIDCKLPGDELSEHGRGLFLARTLAADLSLASSTNSGTELRAVLSVRRKPPAAMEIFANGV
jgi:anti-sigma regulatory factor (Ser/Thr protein kinase)